MSASATQGGRNKCVQVIINTGEDDVMTRAVVNATPCRLSMTVIPSLHLTGNWARLTWSTLFT